MIVALTGASGFLGRSITRALRDAGCALRAIVRRPAAIDGADVVVAALERGDALTRAVDGAEVVVHAAGGGRAARREDFLANNLGTTEALLDAIAAAPRPPRRLILISSLTAGGPDGNDAAL